jgi:hypothetical protein
VTAVFNLLPPPATAPSYYTVTLIVTDSTGKSDSDQVLITVTKPTGTSFPLAVKGKLKSTTSGQLTLSTIIRDYILTPGQARAAVQNGTFEGKRFTVSIGSLAAGVPLMQLPNSTFLLDRHASQKTKAASFALNLTTGTVTVTFNENLSALTSQLGLGNTAMDISLDMQLDTDNIQYDANFPNVKYVPKASTETLSYP